jgi:hypothetical protein
MATVMRSQMAVELRVEMAVVMNALKPVALRVVVSGIAMGTRAAEPGAPQEPR